LRLPLYAMIQLMKQADRNRENSGFYRQFFFLAFFGEIC